MTVQMDMARYAADLAWKRVEATRWMRERQIERVDREPHDVATQRAAREYVQIEMQRAEAVLR